MLSDSLTVDSVLVVPSLSYNLLSISHIVLELACTVIFHPSFCVFQDILTRHTLGYGVRKGKMYYLDLTETRENCKRLDHANQIRGVKNAREIVWLRHCRLGHLSFGCLRKLQPYLFTSITDSEFHCNICELAKSHHVSYLPSNNKCLIPFMKIHSDV